MVRTLCFPRPGFNPWLETKIPQVVWHSKRRKKQQMAIKEVGHRYLLGTCSLSTGRDPRSSLHCVNHPTLRREQARSEHLNWTIQIVFPKNMTQAWEIMLGLVPRMEL